jgi:hypothetical protein
VRGRRHREALADSFIAFGRRLGRCCRRPLSGGCHFRHTIVVHLQKSRCSIAGVLSTVSLFEVLSVSPGRSGSWPGLFPEPTSIEAWQQRPPRRSKTKAREGSVRMPVGLCRENRWPPASYAGLLSTLLFGKAYAALRHCNDGSIDLENPLSFH